MISAEKPTESTSALNFGVSDDANVREVGSTGLGPALPKATADYRLELDMNQLSAIGVRTERLFSHLEGDLDGNGGGEGRP